MFINLHFRYFLEIHFVSYNESYKNFSEALKEKNGVTVLAVLFHIREMNPLLQIFLDSAQAIKNEVGQSNVIRKEFSLMQLLPENHSSYFRYEGSLTTSPCFEGILWTVLDHTVSMSMNQVEQFQQIIDNNGTAVTHNNRPLQLQNNRTIFYNTEAAVSSAAQFPMAPILIATATLQLLHFYL